MGEANALKGNMQTIRYLVEILDGLGLVPTKNTEASSPASTRLYLLKLQNSNGNTHSIRIFMDKRANVGSVKLGKTNGHHNGSE